MVICAFIAFQAFPHTSPVLPPLPKRLALDKSGWTSALLNPGLLQYQQALANAQFQQASAAFYPTGEPPPNTFWGHRDADDFRLAQNSFTIPINATSCFKRQTPLAARSLLSLELGTLQACISWEEKVHVLFPFDFWDDLHLSKWRVTVQGSLEDGRWIVTPILTRSVILQSILDDDKMTDCVTSWTDWRPWGCKSCIFIPCCIL